MLIQATVIFPQTFELELSDKLSNEDKQIALKEHAAYLMETSQSEPIIHQCNDEDLIE